MQESEHRTKETGQAERGTWRGLHGNLTGRWGMTTGSRMAMMTPAAMHIRIVIDSSGFGVDSPWDLVGEVAVITWLPHQRTLFSCGCLRFLIMARIGSHYVGLWLWLFSVGPLSS